MNPITIKTFDKDWVVHRFLDMGVTEGEHCGTAATIFAKIDSVLKKHSIPWTNCISLSVDNASVNVGDRNSIKTRVLKEHPSLFILGCPCHIAHNNASAAGAVYTEVKTEISSRHVLHKCTPKENIYLHTTLACFLGTVLISAFKKIDHRV